MKRPELIVMLTYNDMTVENAYEVFEECKDTRANYFGFKEEPLPLEDMKKLFAYMKQCGKKTVLEVVSYTEEEGLAGAKMAVECGCDLLMGTIYTDSIRDYCKENSLPYMPFLGTVTERPSILDGTSQEMIEDGIRLMKEGVQGFDLLGYRHIQDPYSVIKDVVSGLAAPVCVAGSVDSYQRLDEIKEIMPWAFTIGSAFFEHRFGESMRDQINAVCEYINQ